MNKQDFIAQLERGSTVLTANPVSAAVLRWVASALKTGDPEWWKLTQKAWEKRKFVGWNEAWVLFLAAMHYEALSDPECPLVPFFPSCGGTDEADPGPGVARFLPDAPDSFYEHLRNGVARPYVAVNSVFWPALGNMFFGPRELPYYVVDTGAGAGLNLIADALIPGAQGPLELVSARIGLDDQPLELTDLSHRRWVTAAIFPDAPSRIAELDASIELALNIQRREPNFLQLVACGPAKAAKFIARNIPSDDEDVGLLVFNNAVTSRMDDAEYKTFAAEMAGMMKPWGERALWLEVERVRGELYSMTLEVRATRMIEGVPTQKVLMRIDTANPAPPNFADAARFLYPAGAKIPLEEVLRLARAA